MKEKYSYKHCRKYTYQAKSFNSILSRNPKVSIYTLFLTILALESLIFLKLRSMTRSAKHCHPLTQVSTVNNLCHTSRLTVLKIKATRPSTQKKLPHEGSAVSKQRNLEINQDTVRSTLIKTLIQHHLRV